MSGTLITEMSSGGNSMPAKSDTEIESAYPPFLFLLIEPIATSK